MQNNTMFHPEERQVLIEEYRTLFSAIWERGRAVWLVNSVLIPSSILIVLQASIYRSGLGKVASGLFSLLSFVLVFYCLLFYILSNKVNKENWARVNRIEEILGIGGNRLIYSRVRDKLWYKIRISMWYLLFFLLAVVDLIVSVWNFLT